MVFNVALALLYTQFANENANGAATGKLEFTCINMYFYKYKHSFENVRYADFLF